MIVVIVENRKGFVQNRWLLIFVVVGIVVVGGGYWLMQVNRASNPESTIVILDQGLEETAAPNPDGAMANEDGMDGPAAASERMQATQVDFVDEATTAELAATGPTVLFFKANWCPTCRAAQRDIDENLSALSSDLTVVTVDYDTADALKNRYGVTYQHTWVQVDEDLNSITTWNGGGVDQLNRNIQR